ncbi:hypothetical protein Tco_0127209 [Tanacetum coccineum]
MDKLLPPIQRDMTVDDYFVKIESIATLLFDLGSAMHNDDLYAINGLSDQFAHVTGIIAHRDPFPDLDTVRSMVTTENLHLKHKVIPSGSITTPSTPHAFLTESSASQNRDNRVEYVEEVNTFSFYKLKSIILNYRSSVMQYEECS